VQLDEIQTELTRLQIHPVNLCASAGENDQVLLGGSLLPYWTIPSSIGSQWLLDRLKELPLAAGPQATMNALFAAPAKEATPQA
jgi:hypothetical protein